MHCFIYLSFSLLSWFKIFVGTLELSATAPLITFSGDFEKNSRIFSSISFDVLIFSAISLLFKYFHSSPSFLYLIASFTSSSSFLNFDNIVWFVSGWAAIVLFISWLDESERILISFRSKFFPRFNLSTRISSSIKYHF